MTLSSAELKALARHSLEEASHNLTMAGMSSTWDEKECQKVALEKARRAVTLIEALLTDQTETAPKAYSGRYIPKFASDAMKAE